MKGQIKIEFILGVVVFAIIIFYIASQINNAFLSTAVDTRLDILKARSVSLLDVITKSSEMGLALETNNLNKTKVEIWNNNSCEELDIYRLGGYRILLYEQDEPKPILQCGFTGLFGIRTNVIRAVRITNESTGVTTYGNITMEMW